MLTAEQRQLIFNQVKAHLFAQGGPSMRGGALGYRGENGRKCAIGALIPDELYEPAMEGLAIGCQPARGVVTAALGVEQIEYTDILFLQMLQGAHDDLAPDWFAEDRPEDAPVRPEWPEGSPRRKALERALKATARQHKLNYGD